MQARIRIDKTGCISCINRIESTLKSMGVMRFDYDFQHKTASLLFDENDCSIQDILMAVERLGYQASVR